jgi:hypothetical protein
MTLRANWLAVHDEEDACPTVFQEPVFKKVEDYLVGGTREDGIVLAIGMCALFDRNGQACTHMHNYPLPYSLLMRYCSFQDDSGDDTLFGKFLTLLRDESGKAPHSRLIQYAPSLLYLQEIFVVNARYDRCRRTGDHNSCCGLSEPEQKAAALNIRCYY